MKCFVISKNFPSSPATNNTSSTVGNISQPGLSKVLRLLIVDWNTMVKAGAPVEAIWGVEGRI